MKNLSRSSVISSFGIAFLFLIGFGHFGISNCRAETTETPNDFLEVQLGKVRGMKITAGNQLKELILDSFCPGFFITYSRSKFEYFKVNRAQDPSSLISAMTTDSAEIEDFKNRARAFVRREHRDSLDIIEATLESYRDECTKSLPGLSYVFEMADKIVDLAANPITTILYKMASRYSPPESVIEGEKPEPSREPLPPGDLERLNEEAQIQLEMSRESFSLQTIVPKLQSEIGSVWQLRSTAPEIPAVRPTPDIPALSKKVSHHCSVCKRKMNSVEVLAHSCPKCKVDFCARDKFGHECGIGYKAAGREQLREELTKLEDHRGLESF